MERDHDYWMRMALRLAGKARALGEAPVGAVVVCCGKVAGRGYNRRESGQDATLHAEMIAIRQASRRLGSWRLESCTLYVTLEPCLMCAGAIIQARVGQLVFGANDPKAGACGSRFDVFAWRHNHRVEISHSILAEPCSAILRAFFQERRQLDKAEGTRAARRQAAIRSRSGRHADQGGSS
jgi:tRNA(adenine34) deaminase